MVNSKYRSRAEWHALINRQMQSGLSVTEVLQTSRPDTEVLVTWEVGIHY